MRERQGKKTMAKSVRSILYRRELARTAGNVLGIRWTVRSVLRARRGRSPGRARPVHRVESPACTRIGGVAHPGQGPNRRRTLICGALVLAAAGHIATPSSAQATTDGQPGIVLSKVALTIDEGGDATYTVALRARPTGTVRITVWRSSYDIVFRRTSVPLTFTPANWNIPRTVTIGAVHDGDARDGAVVLTHAASGGGYGGVSPVTLRVTVADDDEVGLVLSRRALTIGEGGTAAYTVALGSRPTGNVRITVWRSSYDIVFRRTSVPLTFTPANWNIPRTVTIGAVHDDDARDGAVVLTHAASGGGYGGVSPVTLRVTVADDDEVGLVLSRPALTIGEGGTAAYTVALGSRPTGNCADHCLAQLVRHRLPAIHRAPDFHARKLERPPDGGAAGGSRR